jgi:hypothetical protein
MKNEPSKSYRVLQLLSEHPEGLRTVDLRKFIVEQLHGLDWERRDKKRWCSRCANSLEHVFRPRTRCRHKPPRKYRGYWCDYLPKLLRNFCIKEGRLWILNAFVTDRLVFSPVTTKVIWRDKHEKKRGDISEVAGRDTGDRHGAGAGREDA